MTTIKILFNLLFCVMTASLMAIPAQIMIIPSAEKEANGDLSQKGLERAGALAPYLAMTPDLLSYGEPVAIFASRPTLNTPPYVSDDNTPRCLQTVGPTAELLSLPIHTGFAKFQEEELAAVILQNSVYEGKNILICWHQEAIPDLMVALGTLPGIIDSSSDYIWVISYFPVVYAQKISQSLLLGDD